MIFSLSVTILFTHDSSDSSTNPMVGPILVVNHYFKCYLKLSRPFTWKWSFNKFKTHNFCKRFHTFGYENFVSAKVIAEVFKHNILSTVKSDRDENNDNHMMTS